MVDGRIDQAAYQPATRDNSYRDAADSQLVRELVAKEVQEGYDDVAIDGGDPVTWFTEEELLARAARVLKDA